MLSTMRTGSKFLTPNAAVKAESLLMLVDASPVKAENTCLGATCPLASGFFLALPMVMVRVLSVWIF